jgi:Fe-S cluster assembly ATPase SufC
MTENTTTVSIAVGDLTLEQLVLLSQKIARDIETLREQRAYLRRKIDERLAAGERTSTELADGDAVAPGAVIDVKAQG